MSEPFGPYELQQRLAVGGMAEVFLARRPAGATGSRWCVLKRMLPHIAADPHFAAMFLDEAKLVAQLAHPGIAQLYDFGRVDDQLFIAMEYVAGATLRGLVKHHALRATRLPFDVAAELVARAALALDYAHRAVDLAGKPLGLIHRDVSPQNILLSVKGEVKLIDFGVAKAATASQVTGEGVIKGKVPYMSPEQLRGQPLDARSDLYGLGLVLYELLAGSRAIKGASDLEISQNAMAMRFAPLTTVRPDVPPRLAAVVAKALQKDPAKRPQTAGAMAQDLRAWLDGAGGRPSDAALAAVLPPMEHAVTAAKENPDPSNAPTAMADAEDVRRLLDVAAAGAAPPPVATALARVDDGPGSTSGSRLRQAVRRATLPWILSAVVFGTGTVVLAVALGTSSRREGPSAPGPAPPAPPVPLAPPPAPAAAASGTVTFEALPPAQVLVDGQPRGRTPLELALPPGAHTVVFEDPGSGRRETRALEVKAGEARTEAWRRGTLSLRVVPWGEVFVDGESVGVTPLRPLELGAGKHQLRVVNGETGKTDAREVEVAAGTELLVKVDLR